MNLVAKIKTSARCPGEFTVGESAALKLQQEERVIFAFGFLAMHQSRSPSHDFNDGVAFAEKIARGLDAVATKVMHGTAPGFGNIPEMRAVWPTVRLSRSDPQNLPDSSLLYGFSCLDDGGRKDFGFCIAMQLARLPGGLQHGSGFSPIPRQGFGTDLVLAVFRQQQCDRQMLFVWQGNQIQINVLAFYCFLEMGDALWNVPASPEFLCPLFRARIVHHHLLAVDVGQALHEELCHKARAEKSNVDDTHLETLRSDSGSWGSQATNALQGCFSVASLKTLLACATLVSGE